MKVPFLNLTAQYQTIKDEIAVGLQEILDTNAFAGGFAEDGRPLRWDEGRIRTVLCKADKLLS